MKNITRSYSKAQVAMVAQKLIEDSRWFSVTPMPEDLYLVIAKDEGRPLPEPVAPTGTGHLVEFRDWLAEVERHFDDDLGEDVREVFRGYFLRGMTPGEAIQQDREDEGVAQH